MSSTPTHRAYLRRYRTNAVQRGVYRASHGTEGGVWTTRRCTDPGVRVTMSPFQDQYGRAFSESQPSAGARPSVISVVPAPMIGEFGVQRGDSTEPGVRALRTRSTTRGE